MTESKNRKIRSEELTEKTDKIIEEICKIVNEGPLSIDAEAYLNTALVQLGLVKSLAMVGKH